MAPLCLRCAVRVLLCVPSSWECVVWASGERQSICARAQCAFVCVRVWHAVKRERLCSRNDVKWRDTRQRALVLCIARAVFFFFAHPGVLRSNVG